MGELLSLLPKVPSEYALPAFCISLLTIAAYRTMTNKRVLALMDRSLNTRLKEHNLYKFIRLFIILIFVFCFATMIMAFASPLLGKFAQNKGLALFIQATSEFKNKNYTEARIGFSKSLELDPDQPNADQIRGLITATYYVENLHEEGLLFICDAYKHKLRTDRTFLFSVHAHLRAISLQKGAAYAEALAAKFRKICQRDDFSEFWAHIPFGMMESLRTAKLRTEHGWELLPQAKKRILELLGIKRREALSKRVANEDFALYFTDQFDELITEVRNSSFRDLALFDAAKFTKGEQRARYLKMFASEHANSARYEDGLMLLISTLAELGRRDEALGYVAKIQETMVESAAEMALAPTYVALSKLISNGDFNGAYQLTDNVCKKQQSLALKCSAGIVFEQEKLLDALKILSKENSGKNCFPGNYLEMQPLIKEHDKKSLSPHWVKGVRSQLVICLDVLKQAQPEDYPRALYIVSSLSRHVNDYKTSIVYLNRFDREIENHALKDDVLTEIGYHKLIVENDVPAALDIFNQVIEKYPDRNSYDNALWWRAKAMKDSGHYGSAIEDYGQIATSVANSRFRDWSVEKANQLISLSSLPPFNGVAFQKQHEANGLVVVQVEDTSPMAKALRPGDRLVKICDEHVYAINEVLKVTRKIVDGDSCSVFYLRKETAIMVTGSQSGGWRLSRATLTEAQMQQLAFGY